MRPDPSFRILDLAGSHAEAGSRYGAALKDLLSPAFSEPYIAALAEINRVNREALSAGAKAWALRLPVHYREQMAAMAEAAHAPAERVAEFLYADISSQRGAAAVGAMCSGVVTPDADRHPWIGRNCDWHVATLSRGTAAVVHAVPGRIPCMALGLMGDIDADTGVNAERLWLHVHTLLALDEPRAGVSCISWLFWLREALETCASLADLERLLAATDRDRGVIIVASDGKTGESAVYECERSSFRRIGPDARGVLIATNHCAHKHPHPDEPRSSRPGSTVARRRRLETIFREAPPESFPHDLIETLADSAVEMASPSGLTTIYSAVACPGRREIWFGSGAAPAASRGTWRRVPWPW